MGIAQRVAAQRMLNRQQELVTERVLSAVRGAVTTYATISASQMRETTAIAAWALGRMIEMWVDGSALTAADLTRFRGIGVARATDGRPLPAVLRAYRVAAVEINELIIELVGDTLEIEDVVALNRTLLRSADELSEAILAGYETAREQLDSNRDQMVRALTDDLLTGRQTAPAVLADRCAQLGIAAPGRLTIVVVGAASALSDGDVAELASLLPGSLWTRRGRAGVLLAAKAPDASIGALVPGEIGIGRVRRW